ncbi:MAG: S-layer homology domain-containing protein, partial [Anaerovorax sp.]
GKEIHVTKNVDGTFSFIQPKGDVVVNVKFIERKPGGKVVDDKILAEIVALFDDVSQEDWFLEPVAYVVSKGVMKGISTNEFGPTGSMTRGMVTTVLYRMENAPTAPEAGPFTEILWRRHQMVRTARDCERF